MAVYAHSTGMEKYVEKCHPSYHKEIACQGKSSSRPLFVDALAGGFETKSRVGCRPMSELQYLGELVPEPSSEIEVDELHHSGLEGLFDQPHSGLSGSTSAFFHVAAAT